MIITALLAVIVGSIRRKSSGESPHESPQAVGLRQGWMLYRTRSALRNLGHEVGRNTVKRILAANGSPIAVVALGPLHFVLR
jgi:hypothetical protein